MTSPSSPPTIPRTPEGIAYLTAMHGQQILVDDDVYLVLSKHHLSVTRHGYPRVRWVYLAHYIVKPRSFYFVDYKNGNKLDNRRHNLKKVRFTDPNHDPPPRYGMRGPRWWQRLHHFHSDERIIFDAFLGR